MSPISFVGQESRNLNATSFTVPIPTSVQSGDALLLFASQGSTATSTGPGAGWTQVGKVVDGSLVTTVWRRVAVAGDAGATVRLTTASTSKVALTLAAYRGADPSDPLVSATGVAEPGNTAAHTTPAVPNTVTGARRVSFWADKNSATTAWTVPAGETRQATSIGAGSGRVDTVLTDLATALTAGSPVTSGAQTATADAPASTATSWTILLRPAPDTPPTNQPPVASFTRNCTVLSCHFDATGSTDPEDSIASYAWNFGDGTTSAEPIVDHTFSAGSHTVTLTVTDDLGATDDTEETFTVGSAPAAISFVGRSVSNANSTRFSVTTPTSVIAGDALLLFVSAGSTTALTGPGSGWTQIGTVSDGVVTTVWSKVAAAGDPGSSVALSSGATQKVALTLAAYRGTDASGPVASITGASEPANTASHVTPSVANSTNGAWRVSYWSDKSSATTGWTAPGGETSRATSAGSGGGRVSALLTDSAGPLSAGTPASTGGLSALADAASTTATTWTVLLRPGS